MSDEAEKLKQEHEDFVHIVAHDFSAPLRHVKDFTGLLLESLAQDLSAEQQEYKQFIDKAIDKLDVMQNDLLALARITTRGNPFAEVDMRRVAHDAAQEVGVTMTYHGEAPKLWGDEEQISYVLRQLFDNAKTFARADVPVQIVVTATSVAGGIEIAVRDNGIGIEEKYAAEIFKMFRRLHAHGEYGAGAGAGLTMVQKIIERHGGCVRVNSTKGQGSTFTLFFPQRN